MKTAFSTPFSVQEGLEMVRRTGAKVINLPLLRVIKSPSQLFDCALNSDTDLYFLAAKSIASYDLSCHSFDEFSLFSIPKSNTFFFGIEYHYHWI